MSICLCCSHTQQLSLVLLRETEGDANVLRPDYMDPDCCPQAHVLKTWYQLELLRNGRTFTGAFNKRS